jgi:hypothetical protein
VTTASDFCAAGRGLRVILWFEYGSILQKSTPYRDPSLKPTGKKTTDGYALMVDDQEKPVPVPVDADGYVLKLNPNDRDLTKRTVMKDKNGKAIKALKLWNNQLADLAASKGWLLPGVWPDNEPHTWLDLTQKAVRETVVDLIADGANVSHVSGVQLDDHFGMPQDLIRAAHRKEPATAFTGAIFQTMQALQLRLKPLNKILSYAPSPITSELPQHENTNNFRSGPIPSSTRSFRRSTFGRKLCQ